MSKYQTQHIKNNPFKEGVLDKDDVLQVVKYRYVSEGIIEVIDFNNKIFKCKDIYLKRK